MYDYALNSSNDLSIKNGALVDITFGSEVTQRVRTHLQRCFGEWFLNTTLGVPWYESILGKKDTNLIDLYLRKEISTIAGVQNINKINIVRNTLVRSVAAYIEITTTYGTIETVKITEG